MTLIRAPDSIQRRLRLLQRGLAVSLVFIIVLFIWHSLSDQQFDNVLYDYHLVSEAHARGLYAAYADVRHVTGLRGLERAQILDQDAFVSASQSEYEHMVWYTKALLALDRQFANPHTANPIRRLQAALVELQALAAEFATDNIGFALALANRELDVGIVSEQLYRLHHEAFLKEYAEQATYQALMWIVLAVLVLMVVGITILFWRKSLNVIDRARQREAQALNASKLAGKELKQFKSTLDQTLDCVFMFDADSLRFTYVNEGALQQVGYRCDELLTMHPYDIEPEFDEAQFRKLIVPLLDGKLPSLNFETAHQNKSGQRVPVEVFLQYIADQQGRFVAIVRDIRERKRAEAALRDSEARYRRAERGTNDGLWEWNIATGHDYFSPRWLEMLGYEPGELPYHVDTFTGLIHPDDRARVRKSVEEHLQIDRPFNEEMRLRRRNGEYLWVLSRGQAERDTEGKPTVMSGSMTDVAERKLAEAEITRHRERLQELVEERTIDLRAAKEEAERANTAKSEFLSRMSHELRTPLTAILGFGQLLESDRDQPLNEVQTDNVREILHAGNHLVEMVNEVLDLSRIESGRLEISLEPVDIALLVRRCVSQLQPQAAQRDITIEQHLHQACAVQADHTRLKQVLINLLSNAIKYNREGGQILVHCAPAGPQGLRISVQDTGPGIDAESLPLLFRPFERLHSAYEGVEGTGIGLALAKRLVEAMHGEIGVESVPGEGSTFWFELSLSTSPPAKSELTEVQATAVGGSPRKLLYVEDNPANLKLMQKILATRKDLELLDAHTAELGLEVATRQRPDLILLDINLPGMDGLEALRVLKGNPVIRDIPVIAVTANAMPHDIKRGKAAGFSDYLIKPIDVAMINDILDHYLPGCAEIQA